MTRGESWRAASALARTPSRSPSECGGSGSGGGGSGGGGGGGVTSPSALELALRDAAAQMAASAAVQPAGREISEDDVLMKI